MLVKNNETENSIDLIEVFSIIYKERKFILKKSLYFFILGLLLAILTPNTYSSKSMFVPQYSPESNASNSLSGLASLAGINMLELETGQSDGVSPLQYPNIVESIPYKVELLNSKIFYNKSEYSLREFLLSEKSFDIVGLIKKYTVGLPSLLFKKNQVINNKSYNNIYSVTKEDKYLFEILSKLLKISLNPENRIIELSTTYTKRDIPAQITKNAEIILQKKIIEFKSQFSGEVLNFTNNQYKIKKEELIKIQDEIAIFKDQNININSSLYQNKLNRLLSDAQILQAVVQRLATEVEQAKLKKNKDTPVFTVIQPVNNPYNKSGPNRYSIIIFSILSGFILISLYVVSKDGIKSFISRVTS